MLVGSEVASELVMRFAMGVVSFALMLVLVDDSMSADQLWKYVRVPNKTMSVLPLSTNS